jgi:hypothetical protein
MAEMTSEEIKKALAEGKFLVHIKKIKTENGTDLEISMPARMKKKKAKEEMRKAKGRNEK